MDSYQDVALFGCVKLIEQLQQGKALTEQEKDFVAKLKKYLDR